MSSLDDVFVRTTEESRAAFIPYLTGGDPDLGTAAELLAVFEQRVAEREEPSLSSFQVREIPARAVGGLEQGLG